MDSVTEATWDEALSQLGGITKQPVTPLDNACHPHSARGHDGESDAQRIQRFVWTVSRITMGSENRAVLDGVCVPLS